MLTLIRRLAALLWRSSIWYPAAVPRDRAHLYVSPIKRVFLPVYDVIIVWLGMAGLVQGFQSVDRALPAPGPTVLYVALSVGAAACLIGCAFPRLWKVEVAGKLVIVGALTMLAIMMIISGITIPSHTGITVTPLLAGLLIPPLIRLWTLGSELGERKAIARMKGATS